MAAGTHEDVARASGAHVAPAAAGDQWEWSVGRMRELAESLLSKPSPVPDDLPHAFWVCPDPAAYLESVAAGLMRRDASRCQIPCLIWQWCPSRTGTTGEPGSITRFLSETRPISMMQTECKLLALLLNESFSGLASRAVCSAPAARSTRMSLTSRGRRRRRAFPVPSS